jgi:hypothetical protein
VSSNVLRNPGPEYPGRNISAMNSGDVDQTSLRIVVPVNARATPTVTWPTPDPITYGDALTAVQLNATASIAGTIVYTPGPGYVLPAGSHSIWATLIPADSDSDAPLQTAVSIVVTKAIPAISWAAPAEITRGDALNEAQLNASASTPGTFDYSPAPGEVLAPGMHTLSVIFTPADSTNYLEAQATVTLNVVGEKPAITWPNPEPTIYGTLLSSSQLCATSLVEGIFEYNPGPGELLGAGEHPLSLAFTPADTLNYSASQAAVSLTVAKATPDIIWPVPEPIPYGVALGASQLNAKTTIPGSFAYIPAAGEVLAPGVHTLSMALTPDDTLNYSTAHAFVSLTVTEKFPSIIDWPLPSAISYGTALSADRLNAVASVPGIFVYTPAAGHILAPGQYTLSVSFTPSDEEKYMSAHATVMLEVKGLPQAASLATAVAQTGSDQNFKPRETRKYKGAVYEKGEDGQWHLLRK